MLYDDEYANGTRAKGIHNIFSLGIQNDREGTNVLVIGFIGVLNITLQSRFIHVGRSTLAKASLMTFLFFVAACSRR